MILGRKMRRSYLQDEVFGMRRSYLQDEIFGELNDVYDESKVVIYIVLEPVG